MFKDIKPLEQKVSLEDLKEELMKVMNDLDSLPRNMNDAPLPHPYNIRMLLGLGRYGALKDLFCLIAGRFPEDEEIRRWRKKEG